MQETVEINDVSYVNIINTGHPDGPEGIRELGEHIANGFKPFGVTGFYTAKNQNSLLTNEKPTPIFCERIWLTRTRQAPKNDLNKGIEPTKLSEVI